MDLLVNRVRLGWNGLIFFGFVWVYPWVTHGSHYASSLVAGAAAAYRRIRRDTYTTGAEIPYQCPDYS